MQSLQRIHQQSLERLHHLESETSAGFDDLNTSIACAASSARIDIERSLRALTVQVDLPVVPPPPVIEAKATPEEEPKEESKEEEIRSNPAVDLQILEHMSAVIEKDPNAIITVAFEALRQIRRPDRSVPALQSTDAGKEKRKLLEALFELEQLREQIILLKEKLANTTPASIPGQSQQQEFEKKNAELEERIKTLDAKRKAGEEERTQLARGLIQVQAELAREKEKKPKEESGDKETKEKKAPGEAFESVLSAREQLAAFETPWTSLADERAKRKIEELDRSLRDERRKSADAKKEIGRAIPEIMALIQRKRDGVADQEIFSQLTPEEELRFLVKLLEALLKVDRPAVAGEIQYINELMMKLRARNIPSE